jgi:hypothetical protein
MHVSTTTAQRVNKKVVRIVGTIAKNKICWDFVHALLKLAIWFQAGEDRATAAASQAG